MSTVLKHGSHDQSTHGRGGRSETSGLPEGWSKRDSADVYREIVDRRMADNPGDRGTAEAIANNQVDNYDHYAGPNGTTVKVEKPTILNPSRPELTEQEIRPTLEEITRLQSIAPNAGMTVTIGESEFRNHGPQVAGYAGFAYRGKPEVFLRPRAVSPGLEPDVLMPSAVGNKERYAVTHEWGHTIDRRSPTQSAVEHERALSLGGLSTYGRTDEFESYAESFAEWSLTGGETSNPAVSYFSQTHNWGSEGVAKAVTETVEICGDTFTTEGAGVIIMQRPDPAAQIRKAVTIGFAPGLRPILKHGSHDQKSHGRRGGSVSVTPDVASSILERVKANGGLSVNMLDGSEPVTGFMVAKGGTKGSIVKADEFFDPDKGPEHLSSFLKTYKRDLTGGSYLGLWHNTADGNVYLDVSDNIMDRGRAVRLGSRRDQISIWDVANFEEINTGGSGEIAKTTSGGRVAGLVEDDGRADRRIRKDSVGEDGGAGVVIRFAPGLRPVLKHGSHDQSAHGRRGGGSMRSQDADTDEPQSRAAEGMTWQQEYVESQEAIARALIDNDYSGVGLPPSRVAVRLGEAGARIEKRMESVAARIGIKRKKRWSHSADEADQLRASYYEQYGKPSWMGKAFRLIRKHLGGSHDQKAHGRGGGGGESGWGDRQREIDAMSSAGPSRDALESGVGGGMSDDEVRERIAEDFAENIDEQARDTVKQSMDDEGWVDVTTLDESDPRYDPDGPLTGPTYQEEFESRMAQAREDITDSYVYDYGDEYRNQATEDLGLDADAFNEVYGTYHTGVTADGREVTIGAAVEEVYFEQGYGTIEVRGSIYDDNGDYVGRFERKFFNEDGDMVVEHALLEIDEAYQGTGFSKAFNRTAENYYISHGIEKVDIHAALDVGGYAWAKQGFDWAPKGGATSNVKRSFDTVLSNPSLPASVRNQGTSLRARLDLDESDADYPSPREVASWGYVQGASTWPGKVTLLGSDWYGQKSLTPSGPRLSTTEQERLASLPPDVPGQLSIPGVLP